MTLEVLTLRVQRAMHHEYVLTDHDLKWLHEFLTDMQENLIALSLRPDWLTDEIAAKATAIWQGHTPGDMDDHSRGEAIKYLQREGIHAGLSMDIRTSMKLFERYCS